MRYTLAALKNKQEAIMNKDQFKGIWQQFKGELKKKWGQFTDDELLEAEGDYDKFLGVVQKKYGDKKEEVTRWADEWYSKREQEQITGRKATESRNQM
jgi:uncharacterized protein YjbJ (UPF0337 family)